MNPFNFTPNQERHIKYGDKIFVRMQRYGNINKTIAEFTFSDVSDMNDIYGQLRALSPQSEGLTRLYVRNVTRGWSLQQPYMRSRCKQENTRFRFSA